MHHKKNPAVSAAAAPARCLADRLNLDFLARPKLNNCCNWIAIGADFGDEFLPFGIGLQLRHILPVSFPSASFGDHCDRGLAACDGSEIADFRASALSNLF